MVGYRCEEWSPSQIKKAFVLPLRFDFSFQLVCKPNPSFDTVVSTTLPIYLSEASLPRPNHKDSLSVLAGAFKRLAAKVPPCKFIVQRRIIRYMRKYIYPQFRTFSELDVPDTLSWINNINHPEKRKEQLREVYVSLTKSGIFTPPEYGFGETHCESFIKDEPYEEEKPLRWINSSLDVIKVAFGPYADTCMHRLVEHPAFIKTIAVSERAKAIWDDLGGYDGIAQSSDATAMEDHYANMPDGDPRYRLSNEFMMWLGGQTVVQEHQLRAVRFMFHSTPGLTSFPRRLTGEIWDSIKDSVTIGMLFKHVMDGYRKLKMRHFGHVLINAILCSGEMNTSFKNGYSMFTMCNFAAYDLSGGQDKTVKSKHEGDDALCIYKTKGPSEDWWLSKGWVVKVEFKGRINQASFCGLVFDPVDLVSVPDIRKTLAKFGWVGRRYVRSSPTMLMSLLRCKALSVASEYIDVPILGSFAKRILTLTEGVKVRQSIVNMMSEYERTRYQTSLATKNWQRQPSVGFGTRNLVFALQNIPVSVQLELEKRFSNMQLGAFSAPELDFSPVWINNMSRCYSHYQVPFLVNKRSRDILIDIMDDKCKTELHPSAYRKVRRSFNFLRQGSC